MYAPAPRWGRGVLVGTESSADADSHARREGCGSSEQPCSHATGAAGAAAGSAGMTLAGAWFQDGRDEAEIARWEEVVGSCGRASHWRGADEEECPVTPEVAACPSRGPNGSGRGRRQEGQEAARAQWPVSQSRHCRLLAQWLPIWPLCCAPVALSLKLPSRRRACGEAKLCWHLATY